MLRLSNQRLAPAPAGAPPVSRPAVGKQLDSSLRTAVGNRPLQPGVTLRNQFRPQVESSGMTPVESSSAVKAFRYDPAARELHVQTPDGTTYVSGEVTPDQAETFRDADSPGRAWKAIRDNSPLVAKILPGGKRIAMKGASAFRSASPGDYMIQKAGISKISSRGGAHGTGKKYKRRSAFRRDAHREINGMGHRPE
jgi:hypothetical protein